MTKIAYGLTVVSWVSFFTLSWLIIVYERFQNGTAVFFWVFFLIIAFTITISLPSFSDKKEEQKEEVE